MDKMTGIFKRVIAYLLRRLGCPVHIVNSSQVSSLPLLTKAHLKKKQCCSVLAKDAATCAGRLCDCLLWRRGSKTAAPRAAVPTRGLPAAQKRARRAENDVNFYNATRKAESSLQHRTGSPESRCCRDLVQHLCTFFFTALWSSTFHLHTQSDLRHLHRLHLKVLNQVMVFNIICANLTQVLQISPVEIFQQTRRPTYTLLHC